MNLAATLAAAVALSACSAAAAPLYAPWAHSHQVWLSSDPDAAFPAALSALLQGYRSRNISVGAVDIDSGWSTGYNNFVPSTAIFPDWYQFIADLKATYGVRVILWMTSMVNQDSSNFAEAVAKGYLVRDGFNEQATNLSWWHGQGGLLDYSNPSARAWWEGQMAPLLQGNGSAGTSVDGWKCDGTDPYIIELLDPRGSGGVPLTFAEYSSFYYGHTLNFSRSLVPDALIWSRPVDSFPISKALNLSAFLEYSPRYVMFSGWVGDQDPTFYGLKDALINIFESAWRNYTNYGSDTGGYRSGNRTRELFCRWAQLNAFLPLFENGGNGDHTPWAFEDPPGSTDVTDMYRDLVAAHYALAPYFLSTGTAAYLAGQPVIHPTAPPPRDFPFIIQPDMVSDWSFALGPSFFVAPATEAGMRRVQVALPPAPAAGWADFWDPTRTFAPGARVDYDAPLTGPAMHGAVFVARGALIPLHASSAALPLLPLHAGPHWAPALTLACLLPALNGTARSSGWAALHSSAPPAQGQETTLQWGPGGVTLRHAPLHRPVILLLHFEAEVGALGLGVRWAGAQAGAGEGLELAERPAPQQAEMRQRSGLPLFWDDSATALGGELAGQYRERCAGSFVRQGASLAVFLSQEQAEAGGELRITLGLQ